MVRFKDLTKVGLALALCFTFAGVGNAEILCSDNARSVMILCSDDTNTDIKDIKKEDKEAADFYIDMAASCKQGRWIGCELEKCKNNQTCKHIESELVANKLNTEGYCAKVPAAFERANKAHERLLNKQVCLKYFYFGNGVNQNKNGTNEL